MVVCVVRRSPGATILGVATIYLLRQPSFLVPATGREHLDGSWTVYEMAGSVHPDGFLFAGLSWDFGSLYQRRCGHPPLLLRQRQTQQVQHCCFQSVSAVAAQTARTEVLRAPEELALQDEEPGVSEAPTPDEAPAQVGPEHVRCLASLPKKSGFEPRSNQASTFAAPAKRRSSPCTSSSPASTTWTALSRATPCPRETSTTEFVGSAHVMVCVTGRTRPRRRPSRLRLRVPPELKSAVA